MKLILVGAGRTTRELLRRLGEAWEVTVVDPSEQALARAAQVRGFLPIRGDGSSRVVLERAGLAGADALVAAADDDAANREAAGLALDAGVHRVAAVVQDPGLAEGYRELGIPAYSPHALAARRIEASLETRRVSSVSFAQGRAEAIEFEIGHDSPVLGRALEELHAENWIVGAVLRKDRLLIPHGDTVLEQGDLVTVVGLGADFAEIVRAFTGGVGRFPMDYGKRIAVAVTCEADLLGPFAEAVYLARNSQASAVLLLHPTLEGDGGELRDLLDRALKAAEGVEVRARAVQGSLMRALTRKAEEESIGVVVHPAPAGIAGLRGWRARRLLRLARRIRRPVLLSRGTIPYEEILAPAMRSHAGRAAARAAIDLASLSKARLGCLAVAEPIFASGPGATWETNWSVGWLKEEAAVQGVEVEGTVERGNAVRAFLETSADTDLLVLGTTLHRRHPFHLGVVEQLAWRAACSVLVVPTHG
jgi:Trk K+ transport system NAD-binding subunit